MRKKRVEEHENHERWLVSYADFITLLFAFFVVLYATSSQNEEKEKKFEDSVRASFKMVGGVGDKNNNTGSVANQFDPEELLQKKGVGNVELEDSIDKLLAKNLTPGERKEQVNGVKHDRGGVRIILPAENLFPTGSAKLRLPALKGLDKIAQILKLSNRSFVIEGHTDNSSVTGGNFESNWELASTRATSVLRYLVKVHQLDPQKLSAASYADQRPIVPNTTEENRGKNRRIEILIINKNDE